MHIIEFQGRNNSTHYKLNLLFNSGKTYIMDNHLAASWCWAQKIGLDNQYNLFHIDRHYDLLKSQIDWWIHELTNRNFDLGAISIEDLLAIDYAPQNDPTKGRYPLFRWDNYLTIFNRLYPNLLNVTDFATHKDGDKVDDLEISEIEIWDLPENLAYWINENNTKKWIVNIDIDYFFQDKDNRYFQFLTDEYVVEIAKEIKKAWENIEVITIALSPELCGGWKNAERIGKLLCDNMNIKWFE